MSMRTSVSRKLLARPRVAALGVALVAAGLTVTSAGGASASASTCNYDASQVFHLCMHIDGSSNVVADGIGSVSVLSPGFYDSSGNYYTGHVQITNPNGTTLCNSITITLSPGAGTSCETPYQGATYTGFYCANLWVNENGGWHRIQQACVLVYKS
ncbi:hypothetical protein ABH935_008701 [Catenulispora sp. GAS73]|uniref:hypothetical protein n=1 Tax=Catenulispora sp. GAS73 TaxID=3156269 RepID=UPI003519D79F